MLAKLTTNPSFAHHFRMASTLFAYCQGFVSLEIGRQRRKLDLFGTIANTGKLRRFGKGGFPAGQPEITRTRLIRVHPPKFAAKNHIPC
jgi:hypothetical protein